MVFFVSDVFKKSGKKNTNFGTLNPITCILCSPYHPWGWGMGWKHWWEVYPGDLMFRFIFPWRSGVWLSEVTASEKRVFFSPEQQDNFHKIIFQLSADLLKVTRWRMGIASGAQTHTHTYAEPIPAQAVSTLLTFSHAVILGREQYFSLQRTGYVLYF